MPVIAGRTLEQLRVAVGYNLKAVQLITARANGSTTTFLTDDLIGGADDHNGKWWKGTDPNNDGVKARVVDSAISTFVTTLTLHPAVSSTVSADTAELWTQEYDPTRIEEFINLAILAAYGRAYDPEESVALSGGGGIARFDIPSEFDMISRVDYRVSVDSKLIHDCDVVFDELVDTDVTASVDSKDKRQGTNSLKLVVAGGLGAGDILATDSFSAKDISGYDAIEFWFKCTVVVGPVSLKLLLDDTASCASPLEVQPMVQVTANTWTYGRTSLSAPELNTAIISVGIRDNTDLGAMTVWLDRIQVIKDGSEVWATLPRHLWRIDKEARTLVLTDGGMSTVGDSLMKIVGGSKPTLLSADSSIADIDDWYIIAQATAYALLAAAPSSRDTGEQRRIAATWFAIAEQAKRSFPMLKNVREVI